VSMFLPQTPTQGTQLIHPPSTTNCNTISQRCVKRQHTTDPRSQRKRNTLISCTNNATQLSSLPAQADSKNKIGEHRKEGTLKEKIQRSLSVSNYPAPSRIPTRFVKAITFHAQWVQKNTTKRAEGGSGG